MRQHPAVTILRKELTDIMRDRRTIISMILVPMLIYPLLGIGIGSVISSQIEKSRAAEHRLLVLPRPTDSELSALLGQLTQVRFVEPDSVRKHLLGATAHDPSLSQELINRMFSGDPTLVDDSSRASLYFHAIDADVIGAALELPSDLPARLVEGDSTIVRVYLDGTDIKSEAAGEHVEDWLTQIRDSIVASRLALSGMDLRLLRPVIPAEIDVAPAAKQSGAFFASFLPYILVILMLTGGMYPALDITAGEKERNTLETLLVAPVARWHLAVGKFLAVFVAGIVTMILSTASMVATFKFGVMGFGDTDPELELAKSFMLSTESLALVVLLMIPTAMLFASLLIAVCVAARSFKEGQSYTTPLIIAAIFPAMISLVPGIELNFGLAFVPIINISLALREVILGAHSPAMIGLVFLSTAIYAAFALYIATRLFQRESILFRT